MNDYRILVVEDELTIAALLCEGLSKWGFDAQYTTDFEHVLATVARENPHLVLLDISLPFYNGYYWCGEIRKVSKVPIVFISSRTENMDIVLAMNMGGDDFITKPFELEIVVAKVQAVLRRAYDYQPESAHIAFCGAVLNLGEAAVYYGGEKIELTRNEFKILQTLLEHKGGVVAREELMQKLWDSDSFVDDNTLTVNVNRLRKKLEAAGLVDCIETKKGLGYRIDD
ncbi:MULTISPECIES: response regulator transcription factor [unclassified Clostridium]|jgi:two-component system response regulator protein BraR/BceR|uniref:response regulator transcription factor n=1 Tax=Clostridia TaxID=186801 RepID=UPI001106EEC7|nr:MULTISPECIES: response regulator transcription factor [unclassified Clostridium]